MRPVNEPGQPVSFTYDYFVTDHLGDVRMVLTEQTDFTQYLATMEQPNAQTEDALFYNLDNTREARPADYPQDNITSPNTAVARLNGNDPNRRIGPSIILKVMAGDTIQAAVRAFYRQQATPQNNAGLPAEQMLSGLVQTLVAPATQAAAMHNMRMVAPEQATGAGLSPNDLQNLKQKNLDKINDNKPKAYLNYVFFDKQFKFVDDGSGVKQVGGEPGQLETLSSGKVVARKNGYVYVYTSNESQQDVLFDNFGVLDITGPVLEETHYYPFGLTMSGISTVAPLKLENRIKFQGQELQHKEFSDGSGLETYQFKYRMDDPQTGRFWQIDPLADKYVYNSPYAFSENKVTGDVELEGLESIPINPIGELWNSAGITSSTDPKQYAKDFGKGLLKPSTLEGGILMTAEIAVPIIITEIMTGGVGSLTVLKGEATTLDVGSLTTETVDVGIDAKRIQGELPKVKVPSNKGAANPKVSESIKIGKKAHAEFSKKAAQKGWNVTPRLMDPSNGETVIPDAVTPSGHPVELKPNTPSGRAKGEKQLPKYLRATKSNGRVIYYDPEKYKNP